MRRILRYSSTRRESERWERGRGGEGRLNAESAKAQSAAETHNATDSPSLRVLFVFALSAFNIDRCPRVRDGAEKIFAAQPHPLGYDYALNRAR